MIDLRSDICSRTRTEFGTYLPALLVTGAFCLVASLLVVILSMPGKPTGVAATA